MAETFSLAELAIPGTYIRVSAEGLVGAGAISTGNIGIVGTGEAASTETHVLSDYAGGRSSFGMYDEFSAGTLNLTRGLELLYRNGGRTVFARALDADADQAAYTEAFEELIKDDVNLLVAPELSTEDALAVLLPIVANAESAGKDLIAVIGTDAESLADIKEQIPESGRVIFVGPGIEAFDAAAGEPVSLPGTYTAAALAGLLSTLSPQTSPTNKIVPGASRLSRRFSYAETRELVQAGMTVLEQRRGVRVVRGLTTDPGPFRQITTRRITDFAKAGIRSVSDQFIGRLNNQRVRGALQGALDGFFTTMVLDEQLVSYTVEVTASRQDEIAGRAIVQAVIQPTFSIDFVAVTLVLE